MKHTKAIQTSISPLFTTEPDAEISIKRCVLTKSRNGHIAKADHRPSQPGNTAFDPREVLQGILRPESLLQNEHQIIKRSGEVSLCTSVHWIKRCLFCGQLPCSAQAPYSLRDSLLSRQRQRIWKRIRAFWGCLELLPYAYKYIAKTFHQKSSPVFPAPSAFIRFHPPSSDYGGTSLISARRVRFRQDRWR